MKEFFPMTGTEAEWNAAYYRLEDYLRALHVVNKLHQSQLILRVLESAASRHLLQPDVSPTTLAMEEIRKEMENWFETMTEPSEAVIPAGLISTLATGAVDKWPSAFLADEVPFEFEQTLSHSGVQVRMDLQISTMVPARLDLISPIDAVAQPDILGLRDKQLRLAAGTVIAAAVLAFFFLIFH